MSKTCRIHRTEMSYYQGFDVADGEGEWFCEACDKLGSVSDEADTIDQEIDFSQLYGIPISWSGYIGDHREELYRMASLDPDIPMTQRRPGERIIYERWPSRRCLVLYVGMRMVRVLSYVDNPIPTRSAPVQSSQSGQASAPSSQPQHSTLSPLASHVVPVDGQPQVALTRDVYENDPRTPPPRVLVPPVQSDTPTQEDEIEVRCRYWAELGYFGSFWKGWITI